MAVAFACPFCGRAYRVDSALAGKPVECKDCHQRLRVPGVDAKPALQTFGSSAAQPPPKPKSQPPKPRALDDDTIYSADELEFRDEPPPRSHGLSRARPVTSSYDIDPDLPNPGRAGYVARDEEEDPLVPPGMLLRWMAYSIDRVLILVISFPVVVALFTVVPMFGAPNRSQSDVAIFVIGVLLTWVGYLCFFPATFLQATPGKALCGLRIVMQDGDRIGLGTAIERGFSVAAREFRIITLMLDVVHALDDPHELTWTDEFCGTRVIRVR